MTSPAYLRALREELALKESLARNKAVEVSAQANAAQAFFATKEGRAAGRETAAATWQARRDTAMAGAAEVGRMKPGFASTYLGTGGMPLTAVKAEVKLKKEESSRDERTQVLRDRAEFGYASAMLLKAGRGLHSLSERFAGLSHGSGVVAGAGMGLMGAVISASGSPGLTVARSAHNLMATVGGIFIPNAVSMAGLLQDLTIKFGGLTKEQKTQIRQWTTWSTLGAGSIFAVSKAIQIATPIVTGLGQAIGFISAHPFIALGGAVVSYMAATGQLQPMLTALQPAFKAVGDVVVAATPAVKGLADAISGLVANNSGSFGKFLETSAKLLTGVLVPGLKAAAWAVEKLGVLVKAMGPMSLGLVPLGMAATRLPGVIASSMAAAVPAVTAAPIVQRGLVSRFANSGLVSQMAMTAGVAGAIHHGSNLAENGFSWGEGLRFAGSGLMALGAGTAMSGVGVVATPWLLGAGALTYGLGLAGEKLGLFSTAVDRATVSANRNANQSRPLTAGQTREQEARERLGSRELADSIHSLQEDIARPRPEGGGQVSELNRQQQGQFDDMFRQLPVAVRSRIESSSAEQRTDVVSRQIAETEDALSRQRVRPVSPIENILDSGAFRELTPVQIGTQLQQAGSQLRTQLAAVGISAADISRLAIPLQRVAEAGGTHAQFAEVLSGRQEHSALQNQLGILRLLQQAPSAVPVPAPQQPAAGGMTLGQMRAFQMQLEMARGNRPNVNWDVSRLNEAQIDESMRYAAASQNEAERRIGQSYLASRGLAEGHGGVNIFAQQQPMTNAQLVGLLPSIGTSSLPTSLSNDENRQRQRRVYESGTNREVAEEAVRTLPIVIADYRRTAQTLPPGEREPVLARAQEMEANLVLAQSELIRLSSPEQRLEQIRALVPSGTPVPAGNNPEAALDELLSRLPASLLEAQEQNARLSAERTARAEQAQRFRRAALNGVEQPMVGPSWEELAAQASTDVARMDDELARLEATAATLRQNLGAAVRQQMVPFAPQTQPVWPWEHVPPRPGAAAAAGGPGGASAPRPAADQALAARARGIMAEINFQPQQVAIESMHDFLQNQSVRTPLGQQAFEIEMKNLADLIQEISRQHLAADGQSTATFEQIFRNFLNGLTRG